MTVFNNTLLLAGAAAAGSGYQISRSLRFNSSDSAYLSRTPASAGNRKTWTWSGWVKRATLASRQGMFGAVSGAGYHSVEILGDQIHLFWYNGTAFNAYVLTNAVFRDASAWMHVVAVFDTTQAVAADRTKIYVNGVLQTLTLTNSPTQNSDGLVNTTVLHSVGSNAAGDYYNGYLADIHFIDGQALTPSSFGETDATTGEWNPKAYTGTYGTNGFKLDFADNSAATAAALGKDTSGNGNNWTPNNLSVTAGAGNDSLVDTPTSYGTDTGVGGEVRGNYATLNPLDQYSTITLTNGNLEVKVAEAAWRSVRANFGMSTGKWYWEILLDANIGYHMHGIATASAALNTYPGNTAGSWGWYYGGGAPLGGNSSGTTAAYTANCVLGFAFNADTGVLNLYKDGTLQTGTFTLPAGTYFPMLGVYGINIGVANFNAGQRPFAYTAPSGFKALCDTNLPVPVVAKPSTVMDVALYTGTGSALTATSSLGFSPDFVWIKGRSGATDHALYDVVRGATLDLVSNSTAAETTQTQGLTAFNSNGFNVGTLAKVNTSSATYAAWCWDAGSSNVVNTQGTITSTVRANPSAGFSIVTVGSIPVNDVTIGHGLGAAPEFIFGKNRDAAGTYDWMVYHKNLTPNYSLYLSATLGQTLDYSYSQGVGAVPTSTTFPIRRNNWGASGGQRLVFYCFAPVAGYSAFGSYTGNGSADGPFVYTGFRPRWVMVKCSSTGGTNYDWTIFDAARIGYNVDNNPLYANLASAEGTNDFVDVLSNGFKIRGGGVTWNASSATYIYAAFAEFPFQYARAR